MKFRKYVIAIIAFNRFRKLADQSNMGKTLRKMGSIHDLYRASRQLNENDVRDITRRMQFLSIPPPAKM
jgi:hypothetical protein